MQAAEIAVNPSKYYPDALGGDMRSLVHPCLLTHEHVTPVAKHCSKQYYPEKLRGDITAADTSAAAAIWKERFTTRSPLIPTEKYDYTMKLALWKIQQYR